MSAFNVSYAPPGPVGQAFYECEAPVSMIMGPIGSAKTSIALMKIVLKAMQQRKSPRDGVRYSKWAVVRDTYRNLQKTTIPSWWTWMPKKLGSWRGGGGEPSVHHIRFNIAPAGDEPDIVDMIVEFIGLGDQSVEVAMRGWEGTGAYLNEADTHSPDVLTFISGRVGRYPAKIHGGPTWYGVWCDMNAPDEDNWTYKMFVEDLPESFAFFRQPGGLDKDAENLENLPEGYYDRQIDGRPDWYIRRMVHNNFGYSRDGKPIFPEFNDAIHVAPAKLLPLKGLPIHVGMDQGRTPAALFGQRLQDGRWRILHELCCFDIGAEGFGRLFIKEIQEVFPNHQIGNIWTDPAGAFGSDHDERSWCDIVEATIGFRVQPSPVPGNNLTDRFAAVQGPLTRMVDGQPGILVSPTCRMFRKGMNSAYRFKRVAKAGGHERFHDTPDKTDESHICEAGQYLLCGGGEHIALKRRHQSRAHGNKTIIAKSNFNPLRRL